MLWIDSSLSLFVKNICLLCFHFFFCFMLLLGTPYAWKDEWNSMRIKICWMEPSFLFSLCIVLSPAEVINPLVFHWSFYRVWRWMYILEDTSSAIKTGEFSSVVGDQIHFLRFSRLCRKHFKRAERKNMSVPFTEWKNQATSSFSSLHSAVRIACKGRVLNTFFPQIPVTPRLTQSAHNTVWILLRLK